MAWTWKLKIQGKDYVHVSSVSSKQNGAAAHSNREKSGDWKQRAFFHSYVALKLKAVSTKRHNGLAFQYKDMFQDRALEIHVYDSPAQRWQPKLGCVPKLPRYQMLRKYYSTDVFEE